MSFIFDIPYICFWFMGLGPHDVRVRMKAVGICGSDVHYLKVNPLSCFEFNYSFLVSYSDMY